MRSLDSPDWAYFGIAWSVVAVGLGFFVVSNYLAVGRAIVLLGLFLMLFSLQPTFLSLPLAQNWRRRRTDRRKARTEEVERDRLRPILAAWGPFHAAAGNVVSLFYKMRGTGRSRPEPITDDEWRSWRNAIVKAWKLAGAIEKHLRPQAFRDLERLGALNRENLDAGSCVVADFNPWLTGHNANYRTAGRRVCLSPPVPSRLNSPM